MTTWNRDAPQTGLRDKAIAGEETHLQLEEIGRIQSGRLRAGVSLGSSLQPSLPRSGRGPRQQPSAS